MRSVAPRGVRSLRHPEGLRRRLNVDHGVVMVWVYGAGVAGNVGWVGVELVGEQAGTRVILGLVGRSRRTVMVWGCR